VNIVSALVAAAVTMYAIWQSFDPRVIMIFTVYLAITEVFIQIRWRLTIVCRECGFDPVIYLKDASAAAEKVKARLAIRESEPQTLLKPPLQIPKIIKKASKAGDLISRKV
jgi:hypothetical protein